MTATTGRPVMAKLMIGLGLVLTGLNVWGVVWPADYARDYEFISRPQDGQQSFEWAMNNLANVQENSLIPSVMEIVNRRMVNYLQAEEVRSHALRVHPTENWALWLLGVIRPTTYGTLTLNNYVHILRRGLGMCGQQALAVVDILEKRGIKASSVGLLNHVVAQAEYKGQAYIIDPDYGVVMPYTLEELRNRPDIIRAAYAHMLQHVSPDHLEIITRHVIEAYKNAPPAPPLDGIKSTIPAKEITFERDIYRIKWAVPFLLIGVGLGWWMITGGRSAKRASAADQGSRAV